MRVAGETPYTLVENPLAPAASFLPDAFYSGELPPALVASAPFNIQAVTDDKPDFNFCVIRLRHLEPQKEGGLNFSTASFLNSRYGRGGCRWTGCRSSSPRARASSTARSS